MEETILKKICREENYNSDDSFVGIRYRSDGVEVVFPMGYFIGTENDEIRRNIVTLLFILSQFADKTSAEGREQSKQKKTEFPVFSYIFLIRDYLSNGLYVETESAYSTQKKGKIQWGKTIKTQKPYPSNGSFVYLDYVVKDSHINQNALITLIHEACLYRCFEKIGWLYTSYKPPKPRLEFDQSLFEKTVVQCLSQTFDDKKRVFFDHLLKVIKNESNEDTIDEFTFGTYRFEYVWEKMIDHMFGIDEKEKYFPRSRWHLDGVDKEKSALEPDTIMIKDGIAYIIDAKYYRYGVTGIPAHLPATSSIAKQIVYAEYIENNRMLDDQGRVMKTYNAFIMPFSKMGKVFKTEKNYKYIGYAETDWKNHSKSSQNYYEHVEGILMDINYIMDNCSRSKQEDIKELSELIVSSFE